MLAGIRNYWQNLLLARRFAVVAIAVLVPGMLLTGWWISTEVREAVIRNTAAAIAISMDGMVAPLLAELQNTGQLSPESKQRLDGLMQLPRSEQRIVSMKIWKTDGTIIYSTFPQVIGEKFPLSEKFQEALAGGLGADFDDEAHEEDHLERESGVKLLEIYAPVRDPVARHIIAVSEFYANGDQLSQDVFIAAGKTWLFVCGITAIMVLLLSFIVGQGSRTIDRQKKQMAEQVDELRGLLLQNEGLRANLQQANQNVATINERVLQHVGADLHDGPAQKLAYLSMRLSALRKMVGKGKDSQQKLTDISRILGETLADVRKASGGLMLPELEHLDLAETVELAIKSHEEFSGTRVERVIAPALPKVSAALKTCAYRFVQEGLNNAYKHAAGKGQAVVLKCDKYLELSVSDEGGSPVRPASGNPRPLGLHGMRARVEAIGGTLDFTAKPHGGTIVKATFSLRDL